MFKKLSVIAVGLGLTLSVYADTNVNQNSEPNLLSVFSKIQPKNQPLIKSKLINETCDKDEYTDFSGDWLGKCYKADGGEVIESMETPLHIENDAEKIKICFEGKCSDVTIGEVLNEKSEIEDRVNEINYAFKWINKFKLSFYLNQLNMQPFNYIQTAIFRILMSIEQEKLILRSEYAYLANDYESKQEKFYCEFNRQ